MKKLFHFDLTQKHTYWRSLSALLTACCLHTVAYAQLEPGAAAPVFSAPAALAGKTFTFKLTEALKTGPVVVYFYPKAFTSGCSIEANLFAQANDEFQSLGATVIGVSGDDIETLKKFSLGPCGGKFAVAADLDRTTMKAYQATMFFSTEMASRISYVVTPDLKIYFTHASLSPDQHVSTTLAAVKRWREQNK
ncbi:MAG: peroxiredoxin [Betaproteobacteria bacterium]